MNSNGEKVIVLKNDAVGDLTQSLKAINNIINSHQNKIIEIYLSERNTNYNHISNTNFYYLKKFTPILVLIILLVITVIILINFLFKMN